ncbi:MAG: metal ABC transporter substrate-binding protein [Pirellulaceae bacterium]
MSKCNGLEKSRRGYSNRFRSVLVVAIGLLTVSLTWWPAAAAADETRFGVAVCSTTQVADFVRQVVGDRWEVQSVLTPGSDPHTYQITPADVQLVKNATLCFENGLHLEGADWMKNLAADAGKKLVTCTDRIQPIVIEEQGQAVPVRDPHAWFDPANARIYVLNILDAVVAADPDHEREYKARTELYLGQLRNLNAWITKQVNALPRERRVLVTSHDAFNYFCKAYGFESAAPEGWSTGAEVGAGVTPASRAKAIESIRKFGVKAIFVETSVNPEVIKQMATEAGVQIGGSLYSDSMGPPGSAGETYLGMMRENVLTIVQALE